MDLTAVGTVAMKEQTKAFLFWGLSVSRQGKDHLLFPSPPVP